MSTETKNPLLQKTTTLVNDALRKARIDPKIKMQGFGPALTRVVYGVLKNGTATQVGAVGVDSIAKLAEYSLAKTSELYSGETKPFQFLLDLGTFRADARNPVAKQAIISDLRAVRREWQAGKDAPEVRVAPTVKQRAPLTGASKNMADLQTEIEVILPIPEGLNKAGKEEELSAIQSLRGSMFSLGYVDAGTHLKAVELKKLLAHFTPQEIGDLAKLRKSYGRVADLRDLTAATEELRNYRESYAANLRRTAPKKGESPEI